MRMTPQRAAVLQAVRARRWHPSAHEVYDVVRRQIPKISLATVYRNLEELVGAGKLKRLQGVGRERRYEGWLKPHYHVCCVECGLVEDVDLEMDHSVEKRIEGLTGYEIFDQSVELIGLCPHCRKTVEESHARKS